MLGTFFSAKCFDQTICIRIVIYLQDMPLMATSREELLIDRNTFRFLFQIIVF